MTSLAHIGTVATCGALRTHSRAAWPDAKKPALARRKTRTGGSVGYVLDGNVHRVTVAVHQQESVVFRGADGVLEIGRIFHGFVIYFLNHVAVSQARFRRFA